MATLSRNTRTMERCTAALQALCLPTAAPMKPGLGKDAPPSGDSSAMEGAGAFPSPTTKHLPQRCPGGPWGCDIPASPRGTWASGGTQVWAKHSSCIAQARPGWLQTPNNQKHTKGSIVRTSPSMVAECARKSSGQRMPLRSVFVQCSGSATLPV